MHIRDYLRQLTDIETRTIDLLSGITDEDVNRQIQSGRWSIGQCIGHLIVSGRVELPYVQEAIEKGRSKGMLGEPPFRYGFLGNWFVQRMDASSRMKFRSPKIYLPPATPFRVGTLDQDFLTLHQDFRICLDKANGLHLARIRVGTPISRFVSFSLGQAFALTLAHERRHIQQAFDVRSELWSARV